MPRACEFKKVIIYLLWNKDFYFVVLIYCSLSSYQFQTFPTSFQSTGRITSGNRARIGIAGGPNVCAILAELLRGPAPQSCYNSGRNFLMNLRNVYC